MIKITKMSTDELIEQMRYYGTDPYYTDVWEQTLCEIKNRLKDSERPKGEWQSYIEENPYTVDGYVGGYACSECGVPSVVDSPFCPWCGADMRGDTK